MTNCNVIDDYLYCNPCIFARIIKKTHSCNLIKRILLRMQSESNKVQETCSVKDNFLYTYIANCDRFKRNFFMKYTQSLSSLELFILYVEMLKYIYV